MTTRVGSSGYPPTALPRDLRASSLLAVGLSWAIEVPLALQAQGLMPAVVPSWLHYLASFGPPLAACVVMLATRGPSGLGRLFSGLSRWRARPVWKSPYEACFPVSGGSRTRSHR